MFDCLLFDLDSNSISVYIHEINIHSVIRLRDDSRFKETVHFNQGDEFSVVCKLAKPTRCHSGLFSYIDRKKKLKAKASGNLLTDICFQVYDRVKVEVHITAEFPLDLKCTLILTDEDLERYNQLKQTQL